MTQDRIKSMNELGEQDLEYRGQRFSIHSGLPGLPNGELIAGLSLLPQYPTVLIQRFHDESERQTVLEKLLELKCQVEACEHSWKPTDLILQVTGKVDECERCGVARKAEQ